MYQCLMLYVSKNCYMSQKMSYSKYLKIFQEMSHSIKCLKKCLMSLKMSYSTKCKKNVSFNKMSQNMSHSKCLKIWLTQNV